MSDDLAGAFVLGKLQISGFQTFLDGRELVCKSPTVKPASMMVALSLNASRRKTTCTTAHAEVLSPHGYTLLGFLYELSKTKD
jgi:hypothetical protein